jgi:hypothetical protein
MDCSQVEKVIRVFFPPESGDHESGIRKFHLVMEDVSVARWVSVV